MSRVAFIMVGLALAGFSVYRLEVGAEQGHPTAFLILAIVAWSLLAVVGMTVLAVIAGMFLWAYRLKRRLAARPCPHCDVPFGIRAAMRAMRSPLANEAGERDGDWTDEIDDGARLIRCSVCGRRSFFYRYTEELTVSYDPSSGIPESSKPLP